MSDKTDLTLVYILLIVIGLHSCSTPSKDWVDNRFDAVETRLDELGERSPAITAEGALDESGKTRRVAVGCPEGITQVTIRQQTLDRDSEATNGSWVNSDAPAEAVPCLPAPSSIATPGEQK